MNANEQFDELARRKLAERSFPFEEAAWLDAQRALEAQNGRKLGAWIWGATAIAIAVGLWMFWPEGNTTTLAEVKGPAVSVASEAPVSYTTMTSGIEAERNTSDKIANAQATTTSTAAQQEKSIAAEERSANPRSRTAGTRTAAMNKGGSTTTVGAQEQGDVLPLPEKKAAQVVVPQALEGSINAPSPGTVLSPVAATYATSSSGSTLQTQAAVVAGPTPSGTITLKDEPVTAETPVQQDKPATSDPETTTLASTLPEAKSTVQEATQEDRPADPAQITTTKDLEGSAPEEPAVAVAPSIPPKDSATTVVVPTTPEPAAVIDPSRPWEISLLGGLFTTSSQYTGMGSDAWNVAPERTTSFGAELVHMGRNIGLGLGLHYGTYADRLTTPMDQLTTSSTIDRRWYLAQVDTTILFITDSVNANGQILWIGQSIDTTVNVLRSTYDTTNTTTLVRVAQERVNRTSYLELPILLDAHLTQGRWSLGLRGGPSIGMLTTRQGSIPSNSDIGYTEFNDVAIRQFVLGWTARAYVRYRFNRAWSVGIEPTARGQFANNLDALGTTRRSKALGCMLSLSYRLR